LQDGGKKTYKKASVCKSNRIILQKLYKNRKNALENWRIQWYDIHMIAGIAFKPSKILS